MSLTPLFRCVVDVIYQIYESCKDIYSTLEKGHLESAPLNKMTGFGKILPDLENQLISKFSLFRKCN